MPSVLVIDDDPGTLESFGRILRENGFDVALARTGQEGLELARRRTIDLVFANFQLADMTGLDGLRQLRQEVGDVPFVIVTGFASPASAVEARKLGASACVEQPVFVDQLLDLVRSHARPPPHSTSVEAGPASRTNLQAIHALLVIEEQYGEAGLRVRSVARDLGVSTEHLCRLLKRHTGHTFVTILRRVRVRAARQLLRTTNLSMKQIADRVGFCSASRFDRDFKKICGVPPTTYRVASVRRPQQITPRRSREAS